MEGVSGISERIFLVLPAPSMEDGRSEQSRVLEALKERGVEAFFSLKALRQLGPACAQGDFRITLSLALGNCGWQIVHVEPGDVASRHFGFAADLGSTSVSVRLTDCRLGKTLCQAGSYNAQIEYGEDILTRIFYCKDDPVHLERLREAALRTLDVLTGRLLEESGVKRSECVSMVVSGNTTMLHLLLGMDPFCVFSAPYAVHADRPGFLPARQLGIELDGNVFCCPAFANYLGGDILSGMAATGMYRREGISVFFDIGTNGELVLGNKEFLLCGAGAAGPALEGGSVRTGMRAMDGAVDRVRIRGGEVQIHVIGEVKPQGICGSGIVDLLSELFLHDLVDFRGRLVPERSERICLMEEDGEKQYAFCYAPGLYFYQSDIEEFIRTKAAAATMLDYLLSEAGISVEEVTDFYMAGAFGEHIDKEAAVTIGMYPDVERERIHTVGNTSLAGAEAILTDRTLIRDLDRILDEMSYVQFGAVDNFLDRMNAALALPHTDLERYPSVRERKKRVLEENRIE